MARILAILLVFACIGLVVVLCRPRRQDEVTQTLTKYKGQTYDQIVAGMGQPIRTDSFTMGQPLDEMRAPLQNVFPLSKPGNDQVEIKEAVWKDGDYYVTIWFNKVNGKWVVVDGVRWHKDVRF